ncbi:siderophore-interacting protein [Pseudovibrio exalbescens]|uniref:siderophore-interacting protein n=1 Tax=Pseudovibrio exalbescens TaxID=197461 RepID=UPI002365F61D|nr:siderophore-interacting protein [Pseudovibrio exalbescens]MDD7912001.1 siderophore-interacting protein [Pseudovibrio exalbescens]
MFTASSSVPLENARGVFEALLSHMRGHDVVLDQTSDQAFTIHTGDNRIDIAWQNRNLDIQITAVSSSNLHLLKEAAVRHLAALDAPAAEALRWLGAAGASVPLASRPENFLIAEFVSRTEVMDGLVRLRLKCTDRFDQLCQGGIHVKLMVPKTVGRAPVWPSLAPNGMTTWPKGDDALIVRYYTIRRTIPEFQQIEIDVVRHSGGAVSDWAQTASPGDRIGLIGPGGGETPPEGARVMLIGDQTALPALYRMLEDLPPRVIGHVIAAAGSPAELAGYLPKSALAIHSIPPKSFADEVEGLARQLGAVAAPDFAWFAGEYRSALAFRKLFKQTFGLSKGSKYAFTYWRQGQKLDAR